MWDCDNTHLIEEARRARLGYGNVRTKRHVVAEVAAVVAIVWAAVIVAGYYRADKLEQVKVEYVSKIEQDKLEARRTCKEQLCAHYAAWIKSTGQSVNPMEKGCQ